MSFVFIVMLMVSSSISVLAGVKLPNRSISSNGSYAQTPTFAVTDIGELKIALRVRVKGIFGSGGSSTFRVQLMNDNTVLDTEDVTASSNYKAVSVRFVLTSCSQTGEKYYVRIKNVSQDNPQPGEAAFNEFTPPTTLPAKSHSMSQFGVTQGNIINRDIPQFMEPTGSGGTLRITATWNSVCKFDLAGCRLIFILKRNGSAVKQANGYAMNSIRMRGKPKMNLKYSVPAHQVGSNWSLEVRGSSTGNASDVRPTVSFTPRCQS